VHAELDRELALGEAQSPPVGTEGLAEGLGVRMRVVAQEGDHRGHPADGRPGAAGFPVRERRPADAEPAGRLDDAEAEVQAPPPQVFAYGLWLGRIAVR